MSGTLKSLRALADPTRMRLVALLERDELSVNELQEITRLGQSRISTHLGLLSESGLTQSRRDGKRTFYKLAEKPDGATREILQIAIKGAKETDEFSGDQVNLKIFQGKKEVASTSAQVIKLTQPASYDQTITSAGSDGASALTEIRFRGKTFSLRLSGEGGMSSSSGSAQ